MIGLLGTCRSAVFQCTTQTVTEAERQRAEDIAQKINGKPGDLIEISRGLYQHWAVYIGENEVVHFTTEGGQWYESLESLSSSDGNEFHQSLINVVGQKQVNKLLDVMNQTLGMDDISATFNNSLKVLISKTGEVKREKLADVVGNGYYQVNNLLDDKYKPRDPSIIVKEACAMVGSDLQYNAADYNCEHFATEMRYGKAESRQVKVALISCAAGVTSGGCAWYLGASILAAGGTGLVVAAAIYGAFAFCRYLSCRHSSR